jgi:hypothetical protein
VWRTRGSLSRPRARPVDHLLEVAAYPSGRKLDVPLVGQRLAHQRPGPVLGSHALLHGNLDAVEEDLVQLVAVERGKRAHRDAGRVLVDDQQR